MSQVTSVRVRCGGVWHLVELRDGRLHAPHHSDEELRREAAMGALGGATSGCSQAVEGWRNGRGRVPKKLRHLRRDFFERIFSGDDAAVMQFLDAGFGPHTRNLEGQTLLHLLPWLDHETALALLPRLLAAGIDVDDRDRTGRTPLMYAVAHGPKALVQALLNAGATRMRPVGTA